MIDLLARHDLHIPCLLDADVGIEALIGHSCLDDLALMLNLHLNGRFVQAVEVRRPGFNDFIAGQRQRLAHGHTIFISPDGIHQTARPGVVNLKLCVRDRGPSGPSVHRVIVGAGLGDLDLARDGGILPLNLGDFSGLHINSLELVVHNIALVLQLTQIESARTGQIINIDISPVIRGVLTNRLPIAIIKQENDTRDSLTVRVHLVDENTTDGLVGYRLAGDLSILHSKIDGGGVQPERTGAVRFHRVVIDQGGRGYLATTYWVDVTDFAQVRDIYYSTRPVVGILTVDNYEELMKGATDSARSAMRSGIDERLAQWVAPAQGLFCRYERDRYLFVFEERFLAQFQEGKFSILETVREVVSPSGIQATLSIGVGKDAETLAELFQYAALSVEMALSRGGDQVVVKNKFNFEFYGGRTKELEKRTKVKSRVMANALGELMADASRVFVMGHKYPDMDCIGAAAGVCAMARKKGAPVHIIKEAGQNPASEMSERLGGLGEYKDVFLSQQDAILLADANCLLVVVDTNRPEQVVSQDLLEAVHKVAVIDHHRRASSYIADAALN